MQEYFPFYTAAAISVMNHTSNIILPLNQFAALNIRHQHILL